jgi:hypothetical protein
MRMAPAQRLSKQEMRLCYRTKGRSRAANQEQRGRNLAGGAGVETSPVEKPRTSSASDLPNEDPPRHDSMAIRFAGAMLQRSPIADTDRPGLSMNYCRAWPA